MADSNETVRIIRVRGVPEGLENLTAQLNRAEQAYSGVGSAASSAGSATQQSASKLNTTERLYRSLTERLDSTAKVYRQLQTDTRTLSGAFDAGFMGKGVEAAARFNAELLHLRQNLQDVGGRAASGSSGLDAMFGIGRTSGSAKDSAAVFEAELERLNTIAQQKAAQIGADFGRTLSERFSSGVVKSARDSASVFEAELDRIDTIAKLKGAQAGQEFQRALNERLVDGSGKSAAASAAVFQEQFAEQEKAADALRKIRAEFNPLGAAIRANSERIEQYNDLLASGRISQEEYSHAIVYSNRQFDLTKRAIDGTNVAMGKYVSGTGLARHELVNLSRQAQDVFVSLASGQSPLTVLIQQGTQIADVFTTSKGSVAGFFAQVLTGVGRFAASGAGALTGGAIVGGAAIAAGIQYADSQREIERAMAGVGRQSGITVGQINRMSGAYADAAKVSTATAREMLTAFASTGKLDAGFIGGTAGLTKNFAAQFSLSATEAATKLAGAFADPTQGAQELNKQLGFLDAKTLEYIRTMQAQGRLGEAQRAMADALGQSVQGAAERTSGLARAWNAVWNAASRAWDALGKATGGQDALEDRLARLIEARQQAERRRSRFALPGALSDFDAGISDVQEQIRRRNQQQDRDARSARERAASTGVLSVLDDINPFDAELRRLETMASALKKGLEEAGGALNPDQARAAAEAYERIQRAIQMALPPAERQRQLNDNTVQTIMARTLAERTSAEVVRLQLDSAFSLKSTEEQRLVILGKINEMQAQANREARDALKSARDQAELAGLRPYERRLREIDFRQRDNNERFGGAAGATGTYGAGGYTGQGPFLAPNSALPASTAAASGLDQAFAASLRAMAAAIPGITITSGYRSYEQQAKLYAEKPNLAAPPGRSQHEKGLAADISFNGSGNIPAWLRERAADFGLTFPLANRAKNPEPWHVEPINGRSSGVVPATGDASAASIAGLERSTAATEAYNSIIRSANDNLRAQQAQLDANRATFGLSNEQIATAQKYQELYNQAVQEGGVALADKLAPAIASTAAGYGALARQQEEYQRMQDSLKTVGDLGRDVLKGMVSDLRAGASGAEIFRNALNKIADKLLDMALNDLFGKAFGNNGLGLVGNGGGGFIGSILGLFKGGSVTGGGIGLTPGTGGLWADGGYTGAGGKYDAAGIVHRGEYVFSAASVNRLGVGYLDTMHRGSLSGYADGGYVSPTPYTHMPANNNVGSRSVDVKIFDRTKGGVSATATHTENPDGSIELMLDLFEARLADRAASGRSPVNDVFRRDPGVMNG